MDLDDLLKDAKQRGFTRDFAIDLEHERRSGRGADVVEADARIVETNTVDTGTDPGDDATVYLIETARGVRGYLVLSDSFHVDPRKAAFVDRLRQRSERRTE